MSVKEIKYELTSEYIELIKLLKLTNIAQTGGHAKIMVEEGEVMLNNNLEHRKRAKVKRGDVIETASFKIVVV